MISIAFCVCLFAACGVAILVCLQNPAPSAMDQEMFDMLHQMEEEMKDAG